MPIRDDDDLERKKAEVEKVNTDMRLARESLDWQDFFASAGNYPVIPQRATGEPYYTMEEVYKFFKARMQFELKALRDK